MRDCFPGDILVRGHWGGEPPAGIFGGRGGHSLRSCVRRQVYRSGNWGDCVIRSETHQSGCGLARNRA